MTKHGTAKKRRRGVVTRQKQQKPAGLRMLRSIKNSEIKSRFDKKKSPIQLIASMGLVTDANADLPAKVEEIKNSAFLGYASVAVSSNNFSESNPRRKAISAFDAEYAQRNINKHGANYKAMEKDIALNDRQLSAKKLETLCTKYLSSLVQE
jgi:hypothetical protein